MSENAPGPIEPARRGAALAVVTSLCALIACDPADPTVASAELRIDRSRTHQTIEGFGAFGGARPPWRDGPVSSPEFVERVVTDLGLMRASPRGPHLARTRERR